MSNFYESISQKLKKTVKPSVFFELLGSECVKAEYKHVGEINSRSQKRKKDLQVEDLKSAKMHSTCESFCALLGSEHIKALHIMLFKSSLISLSQFRNKQIPCRSETNLWES